MTEQECGRWVQGLIDSNRLEEFYNSKYWVKLRKEILVQYKNECQDCKQKGFYSKATTVHHQQYVRKYPSLSLSKTFFFQGIEYSNLVPLCHDCHERRHGYRVKVVKEPLTIERWD